MPEGMAISVEALGDFVARALGARGVPDADATKVADLMVEADVYGHGTHGVFRLRQYLARLAGGGYNPTPTIAVAQETVATAVIDGDNGLGHLAMAAARDLAIDKARKSNVGVIGTHSTSQSCGALGFYAEKIANVVLYACPLLNKFEKIRFSTLMLRGFCIKKLIQATLGP